MQKEFSLLKETYKSTLIKAYKNKSIRSSLLILSSNNIIETFKKIKYLEKYIESQKEKSKKIYKKEISLKENLNQLEQENIKKEQVVQSQEKEKQTFESKKFEQKTFIKTLDKKRENLIIIANKKQKQEREIDKQILALIAKEIRLAKIKAEREAKKREKIRQAHKNQGVSGKKNINGPFKELPKIGNTTLDKSFSKNKGRLPWPVTHGVIVSYFGRQTYLNLEGIFIDNNGIDIRTSKGTRAKAVFEGIVSAVYSINGGGQALLIQHGNYYTVYNNLQEVYVHKGSKIKMNQPIGKIYTNPQGDTLLNFQIWHNTTKQNPLHWIKNL